MYLKKIWNNFIENLCQFLDLRRMQIQCQQFDIDGIINWQPFNRLTQLKVLSLTNLNKITSKIPRYLLEKLGSLNTLEMLIIDGANADDGFFFKAIGNFCNLKQLHVSGIECLLLDNFQMLGQLRRIRIFDIWSNKANGNLNESIFNLVEKWPTIKFLRFKL